MDEELLEKAEAYAAARGCVIGEPLGFGIHGIVVVLKCEHEAAASALKVHSSVEPYRRERDIYLRLGEDRITKVLGFRVPNLLRHDDGLRALEMTIVKPPFVLDFAGAWLDWPPAFPDEVWEELAAKWAEEFGADWPKAQEILDELEELRIFMLDPSPSNIRFR